MEVLSAPEAPRPLDEEVMIIRLADALFYDEGVHLSMAEESGVSDMLIPGSVHTTSLSCANAEMRIQNSSDQHRNP